MVLLIIGIVIAVALLLSYAIWLYFKETPKTHCSSCGAILTPENTVPKIDHTCSECYAVDLAPEAYGHYDLHHLERV